MTIFLEKEQVMYRHPHTVDAYNIGYPVPPTPSPTPAPTPTTGGNPQDLNTPVPSEMAPILTPTGELPTMGTRFPTPPPTPAPTTPPTLPPWPTWLFPTQSTPTPTPSGTTPPPTPTVTPHNTPPNSITIIADTPQVPGVITLSWTGYNTTNLNHYYGFTNPEHWLYIVLGDITFSRWRITIVTSFRSTEVNYGPVNSSSFVTPWGFDFSGTLSGETYPLMNNWSPSIIAWG
jgi:hypothetical protein